MWLMISISFGPLAQADDADVNFVDFGAAKPDMLNRCTRGVPETDSAAQACSALPPARPREASPDNLRKSLRLFMVSFRGLKVDRKESRTPGQVSASEARKRLLNDGRDLPKIQCRERPLYPLSKNKRVFAHLRVTGFGLQPATNAASRIEKKPWGWS